MTASHAHGGRRARRRAVIRAAPPHGRAEPAMHDLATWFGRTLGEFRRRRVFRVAAAYLVFGWLLLQVADATFEPLGLPAWSQRVLIFAVAAGFVLACVLAWIYDYTAGRVVRTPPMPVAAAGAEVVAQAAGAVAAPAAQGGSSVAILPFTDLSPEHDQDWFCDGLAEEIINAMCCVRGLRVASRTASFRFRDGSVDPREIGRLLAVEAILEGSVRKAGDRVRITAQLISAADGFHLWSESFDRELKDVFALQDEIAGIIAGKLQLTLGATARAATQVNPEAHTLLLEGRHYWMLRTRDGFERAEAAYARAIEIDPGFAQAHAAMAELWAIRGWYRLLEAEPDADADFVRARASAERAIALDPALAEPHAALGAVLYNQFRYAEADAAFRRAMELNPNYAGAYVWHGLLLAAMGDPEAGLAALERARSLDPLSTVVLNTLSGEQFAVGLVEESLATIERARSLRTEMFLPDYYRSVRAKLALGQIDAAVAEARVITRERDRRPRWSLDADAIVALRRAGLDTEAQAHADWAREHFPAGSYHQGMILAALGRHAEAWPYLERMSPPQTRDLFYWSFWDGVRDTPEFAAVIAKLGIEEEYRKAREALARIGRRAATPSPAASAP